MTFKDGIIEEFSPQFKSIEKACDRYFDALYDLSKDGIIGSKEVLKYSSPGYLWIYSQYIEHGYIDAIEAHLKKHVTDHKSYGALFETTRIVLDQFTRLSEHDRVIRVYKAAIEHRLKALKAEYSIYSNLNMKTEAHNESKKWLNHYLPYFKELILNYQTLLVDLKRVDPAIESYREIINLFEYALTTNTRRAKGAPDIDWT